MKLPSRNEVLDYFRASFKERFEGKELDKLISDIDEVSERCILCQEPSHSIAIFRPKDPKEFGGATEIYYGACGNHLNHAEEIEIKILSHRDSLH